MPLAPTQLAIVTRLREQLDACVAELGSAAWTDRAEAAAQLLESIHAVWWGHHLREPGAFAADIGRLNDLAGWNGPHAQLSRVERGGTEYLTPPKFFGGNPRMLSEDFVLSVTLNHALPASDQYVEELEELQAPISCLGAHRDYFTKPYAHRAFFEARAWLLAAYANERGVPVAPEEWPAVNERYALYLECYPTISRESSTPACDRALLEAEVFVMALNRLARSVVLRLLRPRAVLLAGKDTWDLLPRRAPVDRSKDVRPNPEHACPVRVDHLELVHGTRSVVVRCNFLRKVHGPNSRAEIEAVGALLAADVDEDAGPPPPPRDAGARPRDEGSRSVNELRQSIFLARRDSSAMPDDAGFRIALRDDLLELAVLLWQANDPKALETFEECVVVASNLVEHERAREHGAALATVLLEYARALIDLDEIDDARAQLERARTVCEDLSTEDPDDDDSSRLLRSISDACARIDAATEAQPAPKKSWIDVAIDACLEYPPDRFDLRRKMFADFDLEPAPRRTLEAVDRLIDGGLRPGESGALVDRIASRRAEGMLRRKWTTEEEEPNS